MGSGISFPHAIPRFFALIQIINDCKIVKNLSFSEFNEPIALVYLSAYSQAVTKSMHLVSKIAKSCSLRSADLKGTVFMMYGKSTFAGRHPGSGPQIVIILLPVVSFRIFSSWFLLYHCQ